ncbi:hypothetical protein NHQ30_004821 [Ciborinia camelliae]|nr:hypothetical protein NHQ30_004821 [Ciborinia camelliae]
MTSTKISSIKVQTIPRHNHQLVIAFRVIVICRHPRTIFAKFDNGRKTFKMAPQDQNTHGNSSKTGNLALAQEVFVLPGLTKGGRTEVTLPGEGVRLCASTPDISNNKVRNGCAIWGPNSRRRRRFLKHRRLVQHRRRFLGLDTSVIDDEDPDFYGTPAGIAIDKAVDDVSSFDAAAEDANAKAAAIADAITFDVDVPSTPYNFKDLSQMFKMLETADNEAS